MTDLSEIFGEKIPAEDDPCDQIPPDDILRRMLCEIGKIPLLTHPEELELARIVQDPASTKKEVDEAKAQLSASNLRLVVSIARKYMNRGIDLIDLVQEGTIGLMKAIERFDPEKEFKFSTYASYWIRQTIMRALANTSSLIRKPSHMYELINKYHMTTRKMFQESGVEPTVEEIADRMDIPTEKVEEIQLISLSMVSLETPLADSDNALLKDLVPDDSEVEPGVDLLREANKAFLHDIVETLPEKEKVVITYRYGLFGKKPLSLQEIGMLLEVTRERARQLEVKGKKRLKEYILENDLQHSLFPQE
jgi:RNA polymerase primary sigma factor